jgi:hypothetical protein
VSDQHSNVSEGRIKALSLPNAHVQPTAVCHVHIHHVKELILGNWQIREYDIVSNSGISNVENFMKVTLAPMGQEIMSHPPHSFDLALSDFQVFEQ